MQYWGSTPALCARHTFNQLIYISSPGKKTLVLQCCEQISIGQLIKDLVRAIFPLYLDKISRHQIIPSTLCRLQTQIFRCSYQKWVPQTSYSVYYSNPFGNCPQMHAVSRRCLWPHSILPASESQMPRLPDCLKDVICINCFDSLPQMFLLHMLYVMSKLIVLRGKRLGIKKKRKH